MVPRPGARRTAARAERYGTLTLCVKGFTPRDGPRASHLDPGAAIGCDTLAVSNVELVRAMFSEMTVAKDATAIDRYYHPDFVLTTNGETEDLAAFRAGHEAVYATPVAYAVRYDEDAWVETADRVAGRVWIAVTRPGADPVELEVVFIATVVDGKIHRLWELTWPDWSRLPALAEYHEPG